MERRNRILVVDDSIGPREAIRMILKDSYDIVTAEDGYKALNYLREEEFDMAIVDIKMAGIDGITLLQKIKENKPDIEVILMTAYASIDTARKALTHGALEYLIKPFDHKDVIDVVAKGLSRRIRNLQTKRKIEKLYVTTQELSMEVEKARKNIESQYISTVKALLAAIDAKDHYTRGHSERVSRFSTLLAQRIGIPGDKLYLLSQAALIHDIGKIGIKEDILGKKGALNPLEFEEMKKHPLIGAKIIECVDFLKEMIPVVLHHHEKFDGTGFPYGLQGESIHWSARIVAIADAIDAMLCDRPYRSAFTIEHVRQEMAMKSGTQFDPYMISMVIKERLLENYPEIIQ